MPDGMDENQTKPCSRTTFLLICAGLAILTLVAFCRLPTCDFVTLDDPEQIKFPIGTQGRAAIYTNPDSPFVILRKIAIRGYTWYNWLYPFSG